MKDNEYVTSVLIDQAQLPFLITRLEEARKTQLHFRHEPKLDPRDADIAVKNWENEVNNLYDRITAACDALQRFADLKPGKVADIINEHITHYRNQAKTILESNYGYDNLDTLRSRCTEIVTSFRQDMDYVFSHDAIFDKRNTIHLIGDFYQKHVETLAYLRSSQTTEYIDQKRYIFDQAQADIDKALADALYVAAGHAYDNATYLRSQPAPDSLTDTPPAPVTEDEATPDDDEHIYEHYTTEFQKHIDIYIINAALEGKSDLEFVAELAFKAGEITEQVHNTSTDIESENDTVNMIDEMLWDEVHKLGTKE